MVVVPVPALVARPELLIMATPVLLEVQFEKMVKTSVVPSLKVPFAVNWSVDPSEIGPGVFGEIVTLVRFAFVTCRPLRDPLAPAKTAVMFVVPGATPVTIPAFRLTVATLGFEDVQIAMFVIFWVLPSAKCPVAVSWTEVCSASFEPRLGALIVSDVTCDDVTSSPLLPLIMFWVAVIFVVPEPCAVAIPLDVMVATAWLEELQETVRVIIWWVPSLYVPVAMNEIAPPGAVNELPVTAIDCNVAVVTVTLAETATLPRLAGATALIVTVPGATEVTSPLLPPELLTVAKAEFEDAQFACTVRSWVEPSLKLPLVFRFTLTPTGIEVLEGATLIEIKVALVTVSIVVPVTKPVVALIVLTPGATPCALGFWVPIIATLGFEEAQVTNPFRLCVLPSVKVPIAENDCNVFTAIAGFAAVPPVPGLTALIAMETRLASVTVNCAVPWIEVDPNVKVAVIVAVPVVLPVAKPLLVVMEATPDEVVQLATLLMSWAVPSSKVPFAVNCCCVPTSMDGLDGDTAIESSTALVTLNAADPDIPFMLALTVADPAATALARPATPFALSVAMLLADDFHVTCEVRSLVLPSL
jgi:hypothetical protein